MNVVEMPLAELVPAPYNPRRALTAGDPEYAKLRRSIEEFGMVDPVVFNTRTKHLVGGHQRLTVWRDLGHTQRARGPGRPRPRAREGPQPRAEHKIAGAWDMPLRDLLLDIERSGGDQTLSGFDPKEIEEIIASYRDDDPGEDLPVPEPPAEPVTRTGDLYQLGPHRLVCGDARDGRAWELLMGQDRADIMWTDPPYGVQPATGSAMRARGEPFQNNRPSDIAPLLGAVFPRCGAHLKAGAAIYVCSAPDADMLMPFIAAFLAAQWHHARTLIWVKGSPNFLSSSFGGDYKNQHEAILYGWKPGAAHVWNVPEGAVIDDEPAAVHGSSRLPSWE